MDAALPHGDIDELQLRRPCLPLRGKGIIGFGVKGSGCRVRGLGFRV
jgi:hypothetical protein